MNKKTAHKRAGQPAEVRSEPVQALDELGKIKDILLGAEVRRMDQRLTDLEGRLTKMLETMATTLSAQIDNVVKDAMATGTALEEALDTERAAREAKVRHLESTLEDTKSSITTTINNAADTSSKELSMLQAMISTVEGDLSAAQQASSEHTERSIDELSTTKADSLELSRLFEELAARLGSVGQK